MTDTDTLMNYQVHTFTVTDGLMNMVDGSLVKTTEGETHFVTRKVADALRAEVVRLRGVAKSSINMRELIAYLRTGLRVISQSNGSLADPRLLARNFLAQAENPDNFPAAADPSQGDVQPTVLKLGGEMRTIPIEGKGRAPTPPDVQPVSHCATDAQRDAPVIKAGAILTVCFAYDDILTVIDNRKRYHTLRLAKVI